MIHPSLGLSIYNDDDATITFIVPYVKVRRPITVNTNKEFKKFYSQWCANNKTTMSQHVRMLLDAFFNALPEENIEE